MRRKTILIADDDPALVQVVSKRCEALGLNVKRAFNSFSALTTVRAEKPDLVCCDVNMPDGNGLSTCEILACNSKWSSIPLIVLTGREDSETIKKCHDLGAYYVLKAENVWPRLEPLIRELLEIDGPGDEPLTNLDARLTTSMPVVRAPKHPPREPANVPSETLIVIDDDIVTVRIIEEIVSGCGLIVLHCQGWEDASLVCDQAAAVCCHYNLRRDRGSFVVAELHRRGLEAPVIMYSGDDSRRTVIESLAAGVKSFLAKPFDKDELLSALRRHTGLPLVKHAETPCGAGVLPVLFATQNPRSVP